VEGWHPVEDVVRWGFGQAQVVMANEAHSGLARSVRTRVIGARMIRAAHEAGGSLADTLAGLGGTAGALLTEDGA
jgi:hypothetical protein